MRYLTRSASSHAQKDRFGWSMGVQPPARLAQAGLRMPQMGAVAFQIEGEEPFLNVEPVVAPGGPETVHGSPSDSGRATAFQSHSTSRFAS
jgi:hypothetical protein